MQALDPQNRFLHHFTRQRLTGESLRDAMLACAGTLNDRAFGPPVVPPLSSDELTGLFDAKGKWVVTKDRTEHTRRSVYLLVRRTFTYPLFAAFDPPELMASCARRRETVVPTQSLALLNSPIAREQAATFAQRLITECGSDDSARIVSRAWLLALARPASAAERDRAVKFLQDRSAGVPLEAALSELCLALLNTNEFAYID